MTPAESRFPQVFTDVGEYKNGELSVGLSLPDLTIALDQAVKTAAIIGTPVPEQALDVLNRAVNGCSGCHFSGPSIKSVGRGAGVKCNAFQPLPNQTDAYTAIMGNIRGDNTAEMIIFGPVIDIDAGVPVLTAPCGVTPTVLFETNVPRPS